ncbi:SRPBCC family protein [Plantactinospora siamensis]|uniref:SRPBCC family protein n=1 Tax=Plantactinospora siamensis TaxID=555372 RepID=A0ABV6NY23_9ACTN
MSETPRQTIGEKISGRLAEELRNVATAATDRLVSAATDRLGSATERLTEYASNSDNPNLRAAAAGAGQLAAGKSPARAGLSFGMASLKEKVKSMFGKGKGKGDGKGKIKVTNIVEAIEVGVPVRVAYNQWTQYPDFPTFMKKVENVDRGDEDTKTTWKAQVFWSHRSWEATVSEQVPDERIVWKSKGEKGHVDGTVTFHEITPDLTRILVVLEYNPQGLFEHTGNLWRAQGRRVRLELKHFVRHVMTRTILDPDSVEGWRGEIREGEVVRDHETALAEEQDADQNGADDRDQHGADGQDRDGAGDQDQDPADGRDRGGADDHADDDGNDDGRADDRGGDDGRDEPDDDQTDGEQDRGRGRGQRRGGGRR